jgi:hypothetical protein
VSHPTFFAQRRFKVSFLHCQRNHLQGQYLNCPFRLGDLPVLAVPLVVRTEGVSNMGCKGLVSSRKVATAPEYGAWLAILAFRVVLGGVLLYTVIPMVQHSYATAAAAISGE